MADNGGDDWFYFIFNTSLEAVAVNPVITLDDCLSRTFPRP